MEETGLGELMEIVDGVATNYSVLIKKCKTKDYKRIKTKANKQQPASRCLTVAHGDQGVMDTALNCIRYARADKMCPEQFHLENCSLFLHPTINLSLQFRVSL